MIKPVTIRLYIPEENGTLDERMVASIARDSTRIDCKRILKGTRGQHPGPLVAEDHCYLGKKQYFHEISRGAHGLLQAPT